jgi:Fuc2NAc and GlcNAc transferase
MIVSVGMAFVCAALGTFTLQKLAFRLQLIDIPNKRSSHQVKTPHGGGLSIALVGVIAQYYLMPSLTLLAASLFIILLGLWDDYSPLSACLRLVIQSFAVCLLLTFFLPFSLLFVLFLFFASLWWINLFNFMDGIDGLASVQTLFMLGSTAGLLFWQDPTVLQNPLFWNILILIAAQSGFLIFNFPPARIFMGDVGSTYSAFSILIIALFFLQQNLLPLSTWFLLGALFIVDTTYTLFYRLWSHRAWPHAHREHLYQRLTIFWDPHNIQRTQAHRRVTLLYLAINLFWILPWVILHTMQDSLLGQWCCVCAIYLPLIYSLYCLHPINRKPSSCKEGLPAYNDPRWTDTT